MPAAMAGLSVLLETTTAAVKQQELQCAGGAEARTPPPLIVSKATVLNDATTAKSGPSSSPPSSAPRSSVVTCSFLHRCFLCHRELHDGVDIYIYRGDRAFCSEECRYSHILVEEDDGAMDCARVAAAGRSRRRRQAATGRFAF